MEIPEIATINGFECLHVQTNARSSNFFDKMYMVRDKVDSFIDKNGLFSWQFEKHLREGKFVSDQLIEIDHMKRLNFSMNLDEEIRKRDPRQSVESRPRGGGSYGRGRRDGGRRY